MNVVYDVLRDVMLLTVEDWAMMLLEPAETSADPFYHHGSLLLGTVQFHGVMSGTIMVLCPVKLVENICANLLGGQNGESAIDDHACRDALCELMNVFSGNFLTQTYGEDTVFDLIYPKVQDADNDIVGSFFQNRLVQCFEADGEPIAVALSGLEGSPP